MERTTLNRRLFLQRAGIVTAGGLAALALPQPTLARQESAQTTPPDLPPSDPKSFKDLTSEKTRLTVLRNLSDHPFYQALAGRCSDVFETNDGTFRVLFRDGLLESAEPGNTSELRLAPINHELYRQGLDGKLFEESGLSLPPTNTYATIEQSRKTRRFKKAADFVVDPEVQSHAEWLRSNMAVDCGLLTAALRLPEKEIYRCENLTFINDRQEVSLSPIADLLWNLKLLPEMVFEEEPTSDGYNNVSGKEVLYQYRDGNWDMPGLMELFVKDTGYRANIQDAIRISDCESDWNYGVKNARSSATGLWQLTDHHEARFNRFGWSHSRDARNPYRNTKVAAIVFLESGGWGPWQCK